MITSAPGLAGTGLLVVMVAWGSYLATIPGGKVPARPVGWIALQLIGIGLAVAAVAVSLREGGSPGVGVIVPAALAVMMGLFFLWLLTQRRTPIGDLAVKVGDRLPAFEAATSEGATFRSDELAGRRTLLKFFRGGW